MGYMKMTSYRTVADVLRRLDELRDIINKSPEALEYVELSRLIYNIDTGEFTHELSDT